MEREWRERETEERYSWTTVGENPFAPLRNRDRSTKTSAERCDSLRLQPWYSWDKKIVTISGPAL